MGYAAISPNNLFLSNYYDNQRFDVFHDETEAL